jgi:hypothetical protein
VKTRLFRGRLMLLAALQSTSYVRSPAEE